MAYVSIPSDLNKVNLELFTPPRNSVKNNDK